MRNILSLLFALAVIISTYGQLKPTQPPVSKQSMESGDSYYFSSNNFSVPINNCGVIADVDAGSLSGMRYYGNNVLFSGGFWLSGKSDTVSWANGVFSSSRIRDYLSGPVGTSNTYPIYVVYKNDQPFGSSWQTWKNAALLGAPFYDGDKDGKYNPIDMNGNNQWDIDEDAPDILTDINTWCVYNDGVPASQRRFATVKPQGLEIRQSACTFMTNTNYLTTTLFVRYSLLNKGTVCPVMDSVYFSMVGDPDLGDYMDDLVGCDTVNGIGYCYQKSADAQFGTNVPAIAMALLKGPHVYIPGVTFTDVNSNGVFDAGIDIALDSAAECLGKRGITSYPGARNLNMTSFVHYYQSHPTLGDPSDNNMARYYQLGGLSMTGVPLDPCTWGYGMVGGGVDCHNVNPRFMYSGDPVANKGWLNTYASDQRMLFSCGPFKLSAGVPMDIIVAYIVARGNSNGLASVPEVRKAVQYVRSVYLSNFTYPPYTGIRSDDQASPIKTFELRQNYPNPFNPDTKISYTICAAGQVVLKIYDVLGRQVDCLINGHQEEGTHSVLWNASCYPSGVYIYELSSGQFKERRKMVLQK